MKEKAKQILNEQDQAAAIEFLAEQKDAGASTEAFNNLLNYTYWDKKDLVAVINLGQTGIAYGLEKAGEVETSNPELANEIKSHVQKIAYNLASFTWPGWDEEDFDINEEEIKIGLEAASTSLNLTVELVKGDLPVSRAYWMVGAQQIATRQYEDAKKSFRKAIDYAKAAEAQSDLLLSQGFIRAVDLLEYPEDVTAQSELDEIKGELVNLEHGEMLASQLDDALRVFTS